MANRTHPPSIAFLGSSYRNQDLQRDSTPGVLQTLITDIAVPIDTIRRFFRVLVVSHFEGDVTIKNGVNVIGSGKTGPLNVNFVFDWIPPEEVAAGEQVVVQYIQRLDSPVIKIDTYLFAEDV